MRCNKNADLKFVCTLMVAGIACMVVSSVGAAEPELMFNRDIRPILSDKCFSCHGPSAPARKGDLRLDTREGAVEGKKPAIVPGKPAESSLIARINATDEAEVMPPPDSKKSLTAGEKETLKRWIEQGAKYQKHWAFETIGKPSVPDQATATHPIDHFLDQKLDQAGLKRQPEVDRQTLIRRVAFTLTGLPPTESEIDVFVGDNAAGAYERMVDRYLESRAFGEEMAKHWLDVARYADTHGLHLDNERQMWAYRDWVIKAFNDNLPFDQFTVWQVAGDLLPNPTTDQLVATGFNRCNVTTSEGGAIADEFTYRYAVERTTTVFQAWLGLTAGCAVCHDHKYDPLTMREFYSLYAFFNSAADPAMDGNTNTTPPFLKLPSPRQKVAAEISAKVERDAREWVDTVADATPYTDPAESILPVPRKTIRDVLIDDDLPLGAYSRSSSRNVVDWTLDPPFPPASGRRVVRQQFASSTTDDFEFKLRPIILPQDAVFEVSVLVDAVDTPTSVTFGPQNGKLVTWRKGENGFTRDGGTQVEIIPGRWNKLKVTAADVGLKPGDRIPGLKLGQFGGITYWDDIALTGQCEPATDPQESLLAWRRFHGKTPPPELPGDLHPSIQGGPDTVLAPADLGRLKKFYLAMVARPQTEELAQARLTWETARAARIMAEESAIGSFIFKDLDKPRESFVMIRGQYDKKGDAVEPNTPAILPAITRDDPKARLTRLDLAKWLVAPENPLVARVAANRMWQQIFGVGLVKTSYDFGTQGEIPSHPELLDWLATTYRDSGWNTKQFVKLLVTSDAFKRQSRLTPEVLHADPQNRLYARGPRIRLDAEQIRDNVLYVSGLIDLTMGGRGTRSYQPPDIWEPVGYSDSNTRFYMQDHGASLYRRSVYSFLKRTAPPPFMSNFDGPNREQVCMVRERSNTPLQALQLMNDIQHFEAARALAERVLESAGKSTPARLTKLYRLVLSREPAPEEIAVYAAALDKHTALFTADPEAAKKAIHVGESKPKNVASDIETAAWTMLANLILNTDETVSRN